MTPPTLFIFKFQGLPPSTNHAYENKRGGRGRRLSTEAESYKRKITFELASRYPSELERLRRFPAERWVVAYVFHFQLYSKHGTMLKRDAANRVKLLEDAVAEVLQVDDSVYLDVLAGKRHCEGDPFTEVILSVHKNTHGDLLGPRVLQDHW